MLTDRATRSTKITVRRNINNSHEVNKATTTNAKKATTIDHDCVNKIRQRTRVPTQPDDNNNVLTMSATAFSIPKPKNNNEKKYQEILRKVQVLLEDVNLFGLLLQLLLTFIMSFIMFLCAYSMLYYCKAYTSKFYACKLHECHRGFMLFVFILTNIVTIVSIAYDKHQDKVGGYRIYQSFIWFLIWSGGWLCAWPMIYAFEYRLSKGLDIKFKRVALILSLISLTQPAIYVVYNFR